MIFLDTCSGRVMDTNVENVDELRRIVEEMDSAYTQNGCMTVAEYYDRMKVDDQWLPLWSTEYCYWGFDSSIPGNFSVETAEVEGTELAVVLTPRCFEPE